jgi:hypothetical protein
MSSEQQVARQRTECIRNICHFLGKDFTPTTEKKIGYYLEIYDSNKPQITKIVKERVVQRVFVRHDEAGVKPCATIAALNEVATTICKKYDILMTDLRGRCRKTNIVDARHEFIVMVMAGYKITKVDLGRYLHLDHTTIIYYLTRRKGDSINVAYEDAREHSMYDTEQAVA